MSPPPLRLAILFLAFSPLCAAARGDDLLASKPTQQSGIALQLPKSWQADEHPGAHSLLVARAPDRDKDDTGEFQTVLTLSADAGVKIDGPAQQARVAKDVANYKPLEEPAADTINGLDGVKFGGTFTLGPLKLRTRQYMLLKDNRIYTLTFMCLESKWQAYAPAVEASIATFQVPDPAKPNP